MITTNPATAPEQNPSTLDFLRRNVFEHRPGERANRGGQRRGGECIRRDPIRAERAAGIESVPTDPEHSGPDHAKHHAVRRHDFFAKSEARSEHKTKHERRPAGGHVDNGAAGEIDRGDFRRRIPDAVHPAVDSPDHVRDWEINGEHPNRDEEHDGGESYSLRHRADDQRRRDDREHELIHRENIVRDPVGIIAVRLRIDSAQKCEFQSAEKGRAARENERISDRPPKNRHQSGDAETLREDRQHIFAADQTAIKKRETGKRHEKHERGTSHHPGVVTGAGPGNVRTNLRIRRVGAARRIVYVSFQIGHALLERRRRTGR